ncbi:MAG: HAD family hydrolase [Candidatus Saccharibacteria bacterium]|nr:HAD family hydrolase [Pseudorhodobacter sp.]
MWSGPRNLSTAMMYAFAARNDCAVVDEPFYGAYLAATGLDHPMRDQVIASQNPDPVMVAQGLLGPIPGAKPLSYQKHMTLHMIPQFDRSFMRGLTNVFLIRHPARVVASYARKREAPTLADIGFMQQAELFDQVADWQGHAPLVLDSADIRADPKTSLNRLCDALGIPFMPEMLHWSKGPKSYDGVWAPHWYGAVHGSTGFEDPEGDLLELTGPFAELTGQAMPYYDKLRAFLL